MYVQQFKIPVVDEQALDEFATNLTAARVLVEQSRVHNTPIFMVAKRGGANVGKKEAKRRIIRQQIQHTGCPGITNSGRKTKT